jgi:hypothetical protein
VQLDFGQLLWFLPLRFVRIVNPVQFLRRVDCGQLVLHQRLLFVCERLLHQERSQLLSYTFHEKVTAEYRLVVKSIMVRRDLTNSMP